jgi:thioredoxin reductase (NADPH)
VIGDPAVTDLSKPRMLIVGAGAAGLAAAFAAGWRGARVQLLDPLGPGGQLLNAGVIETIPGMPEMSGPDLVEAMVTRLDGLGVETTFGLATGMERDTSGFTVTTDGNETLVADVVIIATGAKPRMVGVPGEAEFENRGVSHCAACDGPLYRGKSVVVVGGGDGAADATMALQAAGAKVTLVHRGKEMRAAAVLRDRVALVTEVDTEPATELVEIRGQNTVTEVVLRSTDDGSERVHPTSGVFTAVGMEVDVSEFAGDLAREESGRLLVDSYLACSIHGIFAAGSVRQGSSDQLVAAIGDGGTAAVNALRWWDGELELPTAPPMDGSAAGDHSRGTTYGTYARYFDAMCDAGIGDGLPLVPPTPGRIERFLTAAGVDGDEVIEPTGLLARDAATCAVAAGCGPEYAGIVFAAVRSLVDGLDATRATLPESVLAVVVNGPIRLTAEVNCSDAIFGPGWRANASIGRALRLFATGPLGVERSSQFGDQGQYSFCFGEDEEKSPWQSLQVDRGFAPTANTVTVFPAPIYRQVMHRASGGSKEVMDYLNLFIRGRASGTSLFGQQPLSLMVVIGQELIRVLSPDYTKESLRRTLYERATADDGVPFGPVAIPSEEYISIVAAGGVAFPTAWVFTSPAPPPSTIPIAP